MKGTICGDLEESRRAAAWRRGFTGGGGQASPAESAQRGAPPLSPSLSGCGNGRGWSIGDLGAELGHGAISEHPNFSLPEHPEIFQLPPAAAQ